MSPSRFLRFSVNAVFFSLLLVSMAIILFTAPDKAMSALLSGGTEGITLSVKLLAIYAVWLSVLKMAEKLDLTEKLSRLFRPLIRKLMKGESPKAEKLIAVNLAANMLGMGGAATPAGIGAIREMWDGKSDTATDNMLMLVVLNATSVQLIPATVVAMRIAAGSGSAADIILPSLLATLFSSVFAVILVKTLSLKIRKPKSLKGFKKRGEGVFLDSK